MQICANSGVYVLHSGVYVLHGPIRTGCKACGSMQNSIYEYAFLGITEVLQRLQYDIIRTSPVAPVFTVIPVTLDRVLPKRMSPV